MRWFLALCVAAALATGDCGDCDACLDERCYKKHLLPGAEGDSADVDRNTNTLYVIDEQRLKQCNLDTATCRDTGHLLNIHRVAVDQRTGDVYGTVYLESGIYKLNVAKNTSVLLDPHARAWRMKFKDKLYYINIGGGGIYTSEGGISRRAAGTESCFVFDFIVDKSNDIYFYDYNFRSHIRRLRRGVVGPSQLPDNVFFNWTVDKDGNVMFFDFDTDGVYRLTNDQLVDVGAVSDMLLTNEYLFDRGNNLIVIDSEKIYHFRKGNSRCTTSKDGKRIITETRVPKAVPRTESTTSRAAADRTTTEYFNSTSGTGTGAR